METHSMKLSTHCSWANLKATWSLQVCSDWLCRKLATSTHSVPQHPLPPLHHFTWPTTSWLSCCLSLLLPLCYNTTGSWLIFRSEDIARPDLLHRWHPITVPCWNSLSSWQRPILSQMFAETVCIPRCLLQCTCDCTPDFIYFDGGVKTFDHIVYVNILLSVSHRSLLLSDYKCKRHSGSC